jgi:hypothetical protein
MRSPILAIALVASATLAFADGAADKQALVNSAIEHEHAIVKATNAGKPLLETYLQFYNSFDSPPGSDNYLLSELTPSKMFTEDSYIDPPRVSFEKMTFGLAKSVVHGNPDKIVAAAFADMLSPDSKGFNTSNYGFRYVGTGFLGSRRVSSFDVYPRDQKHSIGRFNGRIWIDQQDAVIVRFTGVFESHSTKGRPEFLHFDSWRKKSETGTWRPYAIYMQDEMHGRLVRGQTRLWAYDMDHLALRKDSFNIDIQVDNAVDESGNSVDVSPLEASARWRDQAEANVIERLEKAGLLAEPGDFEKVLDQIVTNLSVPRNLNFYRPVKCRILLTLPVEATVIDHTILLSKGLIDTIPSEEALASVLALELGHIELGHHLDTMFAFNDKLAFTNDSTYQHLRFMHKEADNRAAAKLAAGYLAKSLYADKLGNVADYYTILRDRESALKAMSHGYLGDSLLGPDGPAWIATALPAVTLKDAYANPAQSPTAISSMLSIDPDANSLSRVLPRIAPGPGDTPPPLEILPVWLNLHSDHKADEGAPASSSAAAIAEKK